MRTIVITLAVVVLAGCSRRDLTIEQYADKLNQCKAAGFYPEVEESIWTRNVIVVNCIDHNNRISTK